MNEDFVYRIRRLGTLTRYEDIRDEMTDIGVICWQEDRNHEALEYFAKLLEIQTERFIDPNNLEVATTLNLMALAYRDLGELDKALEFFTRSLDIKRQQRPLDYSSIATTIENIGIVYMKQKRFKEALRSHAQALQIYMLHNVDLIKEDAKIGQVYFNIGVLYYELKRYEEAIGNLIKALYYFEKVLPPNDHHILNTLELLSMMHLIMGQLHEGNYFREGLSLLIFIVL